MNNKIHKYSAINLLVRVWSLVSVIIFVPFYIKYLGNESYGLVSFFTTLQALIQVLGLGLSNSLKREFAKSDNLLAKSEKYSLYISVEKIYFLISLIFISIVFFSRNFISIKWLNLETLDPKIVSTALIFMSVSITLQFVANVTNGCLLGQNRQIISNVSLFLWALIKNVSLLLYLIFMSNRIVDFYIISVLFDLIYLISIRFFLMKSIPKKEKIWNFHHFKKLKVVWHFAAGLFVISIISVFNRQIDKILISNYLSLVELGAYNTLSTLGNLAIMFPAAVSIASFSTFTDLHSRNKITDLKLKFTNINKISSIFVITMGVFIAIYAIDLMRIWLKNEIYISLIKDIDFYVIIGFTFLGLQEIPFTYMISKGITKYNLILTSVFFPISLALNLVFIYNFGLKGAGISFFILMMTQTIVYIIIVFNKVEVFDLLLILLTYFVPALLSFLVAISTRNIVDRFTSNSYLISLTGVLSGGITLMTLLYLSKFTKTDKEIHKND